MLHSPRASTNLIIFPNSSTFVLGGPAAVLGPQGPSPLPPSARGDTYTFIITHQHVRSNANEIAHTVKRHTAYMFTLGSFACSRGGPWTALTDTRFRVAIPQVNPRSEPLRPPA